MRASVNSYRARRPSGIATTSPQPRRQAKWFDMVGLETPARSARSAEEAGRDRNASSTRVRVGSDSACPNRAKASVGVEVFTWVIIQIRLYSAVLESMVDRPASPPPVADLGAGVSHQANQLVKPHL